MREEHDYYIKPPPPFWLTALLSRSLVKRYICLKSSVDQIVDPVLIFIFD